MLSFESLTAKEVLILSASSWRPDFFKIWSGQAVSDFTSMILQYSIIWYLTDLTGSAVVLSMAMLAEFLPKTIIGPFAGVAIDRFNRKAVMIVSDALVAAPCFLLIFSGGIDGIPVPLIMTVLILRSLGSAFHQPCMNAVTPQLVPRDQLAKCAGYSQSIQSVSRLLSPATAALLYGIWRLEYIISLDIIGAFIAITILIFVKIPALSDKGADSPHVFKDTLEGWKILKSNRGMFGLVGISALYTAVLMPISALFPLMCMSYFGKGSESAGMVETCFMAGVVLGALMLSLTGGFKNKLHTIICAMSLMCVCLAVGGLLPPSGIVIFAVVAFFMGICGPSFWGSHTSLLQQSFPNEYMGRVLSISHSMRNIALPLSLAVSGPLADRLGAPVWFLIGSALTAAGIVICLAVPAIRTVDTQRQTTQ